MITPLRGVDDGDCAAMTRSGAGASRMASIISSLKPRSSEVMARSAVIERSEVSRPAGDNRH